MLAKGKVLTSSVLNVFMYCLSGIAAPFIFKNISDRHFAGLIAGSLFALASLRGIRLSLERPYPRWVLKFFTGLLVVEVLFWSWRFLDPVPIALTSLLGIPGSVLHPAMSVLYLVSVVILIYSEGRWYQSPHNQH